MSTMSTQKSAPRSLQKEVRRHQQRLRKPLIGRYTLDTKVSLGEPETVKKSIIACAKTEILLREIRHYCSNVCKGPIACPKCQKKGCKCGASAPHPFRDVSDAEKKSIDTYFECYKTKEYYMYGPYSYYDMMSHLTRHRLPQPTAKSTQL
ncbi:uncharacterized protein LOC116161854 [Photinus pyralis]|nr:uncharacterized protein LOC116161854 [Photinus pyralis]